MRTKRRSVIIEVGLLVYNAGANDTRGIDIRLDVGQQSETITVTAQQEVIQTQTGAREGVLSAKQIDNLSVIGRSALELLRIVSETAATNLLVAKSSASAASKSA